ncbi:GNAT family N-acetyltransferase [Candidatus Thiothrix sp. Deng01]|uniref:GNAT family N-acetyltransferase n=1 Tax=Candidatus Thiothrix phosphatis TaxID=3112415 RepID=A0ABU6D370_9GAMM|nr:GNAT family N-acetyltransferase [Candidatus Thiothrix sp. Deng01]MEB4592758.1 GNAT family N-acetyltransferase [Candidatus Thiothrix sp. Deng01]
MSKHLTSRMRVPRELEIVLNGPIGPQRLQDDTIIIDEDGWYRTLTPSATFSSVSAANEIMFCNLDRKNPDQHLDAVIAEYQQRGLPLVWCVYPWTQPQDLGERLRARGAKGSKVRAYLGNTSLPLEVIEGVEIERVNPDSAESLDTYLNVLSPGYELSDDEAAFRRKRYQQLCAGSDPVMQLFIARCNGVAAGCSGMVIKAESNSAHLTSASVLPEFQARGVFQSLIASSLARLRGMGIELASGHSNDKSAFWVERFGFRFIFAYDLYQLDKPSSTNG